MIPQETIEQIRQATDLAQIIGEYIKLKKRGKNFEALCPFHTEKSPSFKVSTDKQIYHCFGCGKGGNVYTFLMEHEKMSFVESARLLAKRANIVLREDSSEPKKEQFEKLNYAHQVAVEYFHTLLFKPEYDKVLNGYLKSIRKIEPENIELFLLGLSGESWDGLISYAAKHDITPTDLVASGLAIKSEAKQSYFDRFRQRLMIPIFNLSQKPIAFGGRTLKAGETVKYINSPETPLYSKGNVLYGLNFSREEIRKQNAVIVVEGYFDFISLWQAGVKNVVASSGTAFTPQQARLLARFTDNVYLFFDADSAGQAAALRSVDALFDAGLEVKVMPSLSGEDPDSIARKYGQDKVEELRHDATGYISFRVKNLNRESTGIIAREKLIKELSALGAKLTDPTRRSLFYQEAADVLGVDVALVQSPRRTPVGERTGAARNIKQNKVELDFLSLLLNNPGSMDTIFETISPEDFDSRQLGRLYSALTTQYAKAGQLEFGTLLTLFQDEESISLLTAIGSTDWKPEQVDVEMRERTKDFISRKQKRIRGKLQKELAQAEAVGDQSKASAILVELKSYGL
ncbi:MAG: DNA primase [candidate division Zixibacteria bacterium]|mgnify:CR=1 FL=1|nr:DNA primase [candidate division Zixibacteria bacterium]